MSETPEVIRWECTRCGLVQPFIPDRPCSCGCWWLTARKADAPETSVSPPIGLTCGV